MHIHDHLPHHGVLLISISYDGHSLNLQVVLRYLKIQWELEQKQ